MIYDDTPGLPEEVPGSSDGDRAAIYQVAWDYPRWDRPTWECRVTGPGIRPVDDGYDDWDES